MTKIEELQEQWEDAKADADNAAGRVDNLKDQLRAAEADLNYRLKQETEALYKLRMAKIEENA